MRIYFSGTGGLGIKPAGIDRRVSFMPSYYDLREGHGKAAQMLKDFLERAEEGRLDRREDCLIDSGAWALYRMHVLRAGKRGKRIGRHGKPLAKPIILSGDRILTDFYTLKKGSEFRKYCDEYAKFLKRPEIKAHVRFFVGVDAVQSTEISRLSQLYFEEEHGLRPVPVVHFGAEMKHLDFYLERGYEMIGLGGFARRPSRGQIVSWLDKAFLRICPESNKRLPITRVHGFAMTTSPLMRRWPWYSVDSSSFLFYARHGLIWVPHIDRATGQFRYDCNALTVSVSDRGRPLDYQTLSHVSQINNSLLAGHAYIARATAKWISDLKLTYKEIGEAYEVRCSANIRYFTEIARSVPKWPWKLNEQIKTLKWGCPLSSSIDESLAHGKSGSMEIAS